MLILTQNINMYFPDSTQKERIEAEKMKASLLVAPPTMLRPVATPPAVVATPPSVDISLCTPTSAMPRQMPSMATPSPLSPDSIMPSSQCPSRRQTPKSLNFETTTQSKPTSVARPVHLASSFDSSIAETSVKHKRGRQYKVPTAPTYDDFPENGTQEEIKRWKSGDTKNLHLNRLKSTMKKKRNELLDFSLKNDRKLFKQ